MSVPTILAESREITNSITCRIAGCQLEQHDELAPTLHAGKTRYADGWTVTAILDEGDGRGWEIDTETTHKRELTMQEARDFASAILTVTSWCASVSTMPTTQPTVPEQYATVRENIKLAIKRWGHKIGTLAILMDTSEASLRRKLAGRVDFTVGEISELCRHLKVPFEALFSTVPLSGDDRSGVTA